VQSGEDEPVLVKGYLVGTSNAGFIVFSGTPAMTVYNTGNSSLPSNVCSSIIYYKEV
jgi:hypothetical protein